MIPDLFDDKARTILDAIYRYPGIAGEPNLHTRIAQALRDAYKAGAIRALERAASIAERHAIDHGPSGNYNMGGHKIASKIRKLADELRGGKR